MIPTKGTWTSDQVMLGGAAAGWSSVVGKKRLWWPVAARYRVTAMLKGSVKTGRSHLLKTVLRALERMGLVQETSKRYMSGAACLSARPHSTKEPYFSQRKAACWQLFLGCLS